MVLRQSTSQLIRFGPFLDSTDGVTSETGLTIAQADMQLSKDGATFAQKNASGNATHDTDGWYSTTLDTTDTATVGILKLQIVVAGSVPVWETFYVIEEAIYDDLYAASSVGYLKPTVASRTLDITATGTAGIDWANVENQSTAVDLSGTDIQLADTVTTYTGDTPQTGDSFARLGAPAGASVSADIAVIDGIVDNILFDTAEIGTAGAGLTDLGGMSTGMKAEVNAEADTALTDYDGPTNTEMIARTLLSANYFDPAADAVANVTLVATTTTNTDMVGTNSALLAASINLTGGAVDTVTTVTNQVTVNDILTTQMTESYAVDGTAPTQAQALFLIQQVLTEFAINGTTTTIKKLDGSTTAAILTHDSETDATDSTRTS